MKLVRFLHKNSVYKGILHGDTIEVTEPAETLKTIGMEEATLLAPVEPSKIVLVGLNYRDHAKELEMPIPEEPVIFIKPSTAVIGPGDAILYPKTAARVDYEAELAVVIKNKIKNISAREAASHIAGFTCFNDVTARDLQRKDVQWTRAKSFDTFAPVGPWIETDLDVGDLRICSYLNGETKQDSRTSDLIFGIPELVSFVSGVMTLLPGDVIATGTPSGIGPMKPGDEITIEVEGIGKLTNRIEGGK